MREPLGKDYRRRRCFRSAFLAALGALAPFAAHAGPSDLNVRLRCPVLSDTAASEFEARAKVDLSARAAGGELEVVCVGLSAQMRWRASGAKSSAARSLPSASSPAGLVDALLIAAAELVEEAARSEAEAAPLAPDPPPPEEAKSDPAEEEVRRERARPRTDVDDSLAMRADSEPVVVVKNQPWLGIGFTLGGRAAADVTSGSGLVGPSLGIYLALPSSFVATLRGSYDWGLGAGNIVQVRSVSESLVLGYRMGEHRDYEFGAGGTLGTLLVDANAPYLPSTASEPYFRVELYARYAYGNNSFRMLVGPDVHIYAVSTDVAVSGLSVWQLPPIAVGLTLELSAALYGTR